MIKFLMHRLRLVFSSQQGLVAGGAFQVIYPESIVGSNRTIRMNYATACNYASIGKGDVVKFGQDKVLWSYRK